MTVPLVARAAAGLSAVVLLAGCATTSGVRVGAAPAASAAPSTTAPVVPPGEVHSAAAATAKATAILTLVTLPSGSTTLAISPTPNLASPPEVPASDNLIDVPAFYSVPMTETAFAAYLKTLTVTGFTEYSSSFGGTVTSVGLGANTVGFDAELYVSYQDLGDRLGVRVDAQVIWLPPKTAAEQIPATLSRATLAYTGPIDSFGGSGDTTPKPKHAHVVVTGEALRRIVSALNHLAVDPPGESNCPADFGETAVVTMSFGGHRVVDRVSLSGCQGVYVTSDGHAQPGLYSSDALIHALYAAVGIRFTPIPAVTPQGPPVRTLAKPFTLQHNKVQAQRVGDRALGFGGQFPQDSRYSGPVNSPTKPPYLGKGTLVDRAEFETINGKMADLVSWFRANPGPGNIAAEPYQEKHGIRRLDLEPKDRTKPTSANVWISMVQKGSQVVFRVDAQTAY